METAGDADLVLQRVLAAVIDLLICYVLVEIPLLYAVSVFFRPQFEALGPAAIVLSLALLLPLWITYSFAFEWLFARTPGKVNRGLMVVTADGDPCTLGASARRNLLRYVDVLGIPPLVVGTLLPLLADGQRVGDVVADTRVVRVKPPEHEPMLSEEEREAERSEASDRASGETARRETWEEALEEGTEPGGIAGGTGDDR